jgi:hypothetical protein
MADNTFVTLLPSSTGSTEEIVSVVVTFASVRTGRICG